METVSLNSAYGITECYFIFLKVVHFICSMLLFTLVFGCFGLIIFMLINMQLLSTVNNMLYSLLFTIVSYLFLIWILFMIEKRLQIRNNTTPTNLPNRTQEYRIAIPLAVGLSLSTGQNPSQRTYHNDSSDPENPS